mgnify:CR=1 FL=1
MPEYTLSGVERTLLLEIEQRAQQAAAAAIAPFNSQSEGILTLICLQQSLQGRVQLSADKTKIAKVEEG